MSEKQIAAETTDETLDRVHGTLAQYRGIYQRKGFADAADTVSTGMRALQDYADDNAARHAAGNWRVGSMVGESTWLWDTKQLKREYENMAQRWLARADKQAGGLLSSLISELPVHKRVKKTPNLSTSAKVAGGLLLILSGVYLARRN